MLDVISAVLSIVLIDLVLSGDNAVVIGMAARNLPRRQRRVAILFGGLAAIILRVTLTAAATLLLQVPALSLVGGLVLLWIAFKLLKEEEETGEGIRVATSVREAVLTILVADFVMSLDNVLGVAAAAGGSLPLLAFGLLFSMAILMVGGGLLADVIGRLAWLAYVGSAVIAWTGASMILGDGFVARTRLLSAQVAPIAAWVITGLVVGFAHVWHRRLPARRRRRLEGARRAPSAAHAQPHSASPRTPLPASGRASRDRAPGLPARQEPSRP